MATELEITFDGDTEALRDHRLSVREFGRALNALLAAIQRTATNLTNQTTREGAFTRRARQIDLELRSVTSGSARVAFAITEPPEPQASLIEDPNVSTAAAVARLIDDIEAESRGETRSRPARRYLGSLPEGLKTQSYRLTSNGTVLRALSLSSVNLSPAELPLPSIRTLIGQISSVGFPPSTYTVGITDDEKSTECEATQPQVESALMLRGYTVYASVVVHENRFRLVALRQRVFSPIPEDERLTLLAKHWNKTLELLSR